MSKPKIYFLEMVGIKHRAVKGVSLDPEILKAQFNEASRVANRSTHHDFDGWHHFEIMEYEISDLKLITEGIDADNLEDKGKIMFTTERSLSELHTPNRYEWKTS